MPRILVCPIAYNENVKLKNGIERFLACDLHDRLDYLIVDDASDDGTTEMIASYAQAGVMTIRHAQRRGVGFGIRTAIQYGLDHGYDIMVIMAGNDKDNPQEISRLITPIIEQGYDLVQGSRYKGHNGVGGDMPFYRKIATKLHPLLMSLITRTKITDSTNGFRAFKLSILRHPEIRLDQEWLNQYELEPYLLFKAITLGYKFTEAPVTKIYPASKLGYTKMKPITGWWSILRPLFYLGFGIKK
jgi:glycosyltransferase involved in cell wall biosynthesis